MVLVPAWWYWLPIASICDDVGVLTVLDVSNIVILRQFGVLHRCPLVLETGVFVYFGISKDVYQGQVHRNQNIFTESSQPRPDRDRLTDRQTDG